MEINNKEQIDLINDLGFNKSAVSTWYNGTRLPRMDKVEKLAQYFNINRSDLIEEKNNQSSKDTHRKSVVINVYGRVAAGIPLEMIEDIGEIVIATINGNDAVCKRLRKYKDGMELISTNPSYEPMFFTNREISEKPITILDKVVELRAKF